MPQHRNEFTRLYIQRYVVECPHLSVDVALVISCDIIMNQLFDLYHSLG